MTDASVRPGLYFYWLMQGTPAPHYYFVLTNPDSNGDVLVVNMRSRPHSGDFDGSCILSRGDEAFVKHPSYVFYREAAPMPASNVAEAIRHRKGKKCGQLKPHIFARILEGAHKTKRMRQEVRDKFFP